MVPWCIECLWKPYKNPVNWRVGALNSDPLRQCWLRDQAQTSNKTLACFTVVSAPWWSLGTTELGITIILSQLGVLKQSLSKWIKEQTFLIVPKAGQSKDEVANGFSFWWYLSSWFTDGHFILYPQTVGTEEALVARSLTINALPPERLHPQSLNQT